MANGLQKVIYNLANAVPLMVMTALTRWIEFHRWRILVIMLSLATVVTILFVICFCYGKNNCSIKNINVCKVVSKDPWLVAYVLSYILPFAYKAMPDYHIVSLIVVLLMLGYVILPAIMALPNILLFFRGYHFYEVETETGVGGYILISKRRIRNKSEIKTVMRVFERLLIDTKEDR